MNHLFFRDQMRGFVDETHQRTNVTRPVVQQISGVFRFRETDDAFQTVNLRFHRFVYNKTRQEFLRFLHSQNKRMLLVNSICNIH